MDLKWIERISNNGPQMNIQIFNGKKRCETALIEWVWNGFNGFQMDRMDLKWIGGKKLIWEWIWDWINESQIVCFTFSSPLLLCNTHQNLIAVYYSVLTNFYPPIICPSGQCNGLAMLAGGLIARVIGGRWRLCWSSGWMSALSWPRAPCPCHARPCQPGRSSSSSSSSSSASSSSSCHASPCQPNQSHDFVIFHIHLTNFTPRKRTNGNKFSISIE